MVYKGRRGIASKTMSLATRDAVGRTWAEVHGRG